MEKQWVSIVIASLFPSLKQFLVVGILKGFPVPKSYTIILYVSY